MRQHVRNRTNKSTYKQGEQVICILQGGSSYTDLKHSYLHFQIEVDALCKLDAGAISFIKNIVITSASGDEIERINNVNILSHQLLNWTKPNSWFLNDGTTYGYQYKTSDMPVGTEHFVIPLNLISGFCNYDKLLPSFIASGLQFTFELETDARALTHASNAPSYTMSDVYIVTENTKLTDSVHKVLTADSANNGLNIEYSTWYHSPFSLSSGSTTGDFNVMRTVSRAQQAVVVTQSFSSAQEKSTNVMEGSKLDADRYQRVQFRTGSIYYPNTPLTNEPEMIYMTNHALGRINRKDVSNNVSLGKWVSSGHAMPAVDLERSSLQMLSAIPLNTSRVLSADLGFKSVSANDRKINIYLRYTRIVRAHTSNISVEE